MEQIRKLWTNVKRSINHSVIPFGEVLFLIKHFNKGPFRLGAPCNSCSTATDLSQESAKAPSSGIFLVRMHALMKLLHSKSALKLQERIVILMQGYHDFSSNSAQNPSRQLKIPLNIDNHTLLWKYYIVDGK